MLDLIEQLFDADSFFDHLIVIEGQFGNAPHVMQAFAERAPNEAGSRPQALKALLALCFIAQYRYENASMVKIRRDLDAGHRDQADARILNLAFDDLAEL